MGTVKIVTFEGLQRYHENLMKCINAKLELHDIGKTNCPNCGAIITSSKCAYCGTDFMIWKGMTFD